MRARAGARRTAAYMVTHALVVGAVLAVTAAPALAARPVGGGGGGAHGGGHGGGQGAGSTATGNDVSYPQCGTTLPQGSAFGIVGVNGGLANDLNPCFGPSSTYSSYSQSELYWAVSSTTGATVQPKASLYVNTGDPGNAYNGAPVSDWPVSGSTPDGTCTTTTYVTSTAVYVVGQDSTACAWQYGYEKALQDVSWLSTAAAAIDGQAPPIAVAGTATAYPWWLDVETANTWQAGTAGQAMNTAVLQGMVTALEQEGAATVGVYSTSSQWSQITGGTTSSTATLFGLPDWVPGARTLSQAKANCTQAPFTGGAGGVTITQWTGHPDNDYAC